MSAPLVEIELADMTPDAGHEEGMGGRGLGIVEALAAKCGVKETLPVGKWVWARVVA